MPDKLCGLLLYVYYLIYSIKKGSLYVSYLMSKKDCPFFASHYLKRGSTSWAYSTSRIRGFFLAESVIDLNGSGFFYWIKKCQCSKCLECLVVALLDGN